MVNRIEQRAFQIEIELEASFTPGYTGDQSDYRWAAHWDHDLKSHLSSLLMRHLLEKLGTDWKASMHDDGSHEPDRVDIVIKRTFAEP